MAQTSAASYKFNTMQEIKSHSSVLFNERMAILFYLLDMKAIQMNINYDTGMIREVNGIIKQIYKNIRTLIRNNPTMRATLNLDTKEEGIYVTDVAVGMIDKMLDYCECNGYTPKKNYIISQELNRVEMIIKDILQYYSYFIRPDFKQKPDIELATEKYKDIADRKTIEELRSLAGKRNKIDFENLGKSKISMEDDNDYDEDLDGDLDELELEEIKKLE